MEDQDLTPNNTSSLDWLNLAETLAVVVSIGGSIASIFIQQVALATVPLSATVAINFVNRRRLMTMIQAEHRDNISQLAQYTQGNVEILTEQIAELQQKTLAEMKQQFEGNHQQLLSLSGQLQQLREVHVTSLQNNLKQTQDNLQNLQEIVTNLRDGTIEELVERQMLKEQTKVQQMNIDSLSGQLTEVQRKTLAELSKSTSSQQKTLQELNGKLSSVEEVALQLKEGTSDLHEQTQSLESQQREIAETVACLKQIENFSLLIQVNPNDDNAYYQRGSLHQRLGNFDAAVADFTEAIQANAEQAYAYYQRGVIRSKKLDRQNAILDLRMAAKLFFDQGDLTHYQEAKDLSKQLHELGEKVLPDEQAERLMVGGLFNN